MAGFVLLFGLPAGCRPATSNNSARSQSANTAGPSGNTATTLQDTSAGNETSVPVGNPTPPRSPSRTDASPAPATSGPRPALSPSLSTSTPGPLRGTVIHLPTPPAPAELTTTPATFTKIAVNGDWCNLSFTLSNAGPGAASGLTVDVTLKEYAVLGLPTETDKGLYGPSSLAGGNSYKYQLGAYIPGPYYVTITATAKTGSTAWQGWVTC